MAKVPNESSKKDLKYCKTGKSICILAGAGKYWMFDYKSLQSYLICITMAMLINIALTRIVYNTKFITLSPSNISFVI